MSAHGPAEGRGAPSARGRAPAAARGDDAGGAAAAVYTLAQVQHLLRVEFGRLARYGEGLAVWIVELEGLAALREREGAEAKAGALERLAALLAREARPSDHVGRYTLDRFAVLAPSLPGEPDEALARRLVERGRAAGLSLAIGGGRARGAGLLFHDALLTAAEAALGSARVAGGGAFRLGEAGDAGDATSRDAGADRREA